jgi:hypothetical protein
MIVKSLLFIGNLVLAAPFSHEASTFYQMLNLGNIQPANFAKPDRSIVSQKLEKVVAS